MQFSHRDDSSRTATLEGAFPAFSVSHTDAGGKARKKSFKQHDPALRFLLDEGFILRPGARLHAEVVRWMRRIDGPNLGTIRHAADASDVWVGDGDDTLHHIDAATCAHRSVTLGTGKRFAQQMAIGASESVWVWRHTQLTANRDETVGELLWVENVDGQLKKHVVLTLQGSQAFYVRMASDARGQLLGPSQQGAALYSPSGMALRTWPHQPGALSENGQWALLIDGENLLQVNLETDATETLSTPASHVGALQISNTGEVFGEVLRKDGRMWGTYRLTGEPTCLSVDGYARVSNDGNHLVEVDATGIKLRDVHKPNNDTPLDRTEIIARKSLPILGVAKQAKALWVSPSELIVLTDAYTVASIDVSALRG